MSRKLLALLERKLGELKAEYAKARERFEKEYENVFFLNLNYEDGIMEPLIENWPAFPFDWRQKKYTWFEDGNSHEFIGTEEEFRRFRDSLLIPKGIKLGEARRALERAEAKEKQLMEKIEALDTQIQEVAVGLGNNRRKERIKQKIANAESLPPDLQAEEIDYWREKLDG